MKVKKIMILLITVCLIVVCNTGVYSAQIGDEVIVGGMPFGIKFYTEGVLVCGVSEVDTEKGNLSPGEMAGIKKGDIILEINGENITSVNDVISYTKSSEGNAMTLDIKRMNKDLKIEIYPALSVSEKEFKLGLWIKDGTAGIGTVTYIEETDNEFAGLGHGVCDVETGSVLRLKSADVCDVTLTSVKIGKKGVPGELRGIISENKTGYLTKNSNHGVFGFFKELPTGKMTCKIAGSKEIAVGDATILCTLDDNIISEYSIKIEKISDNSENTKNFMIKVTDTKLIEKTGGIVQGMSGSPIIQNGKLVGAVTHVLVDDPTKGYGIFIENMLN